MLDSPASLHLSNVPRHNLKICMKHRASLLNRNPVCPLIKEVARHSRIRLNRRLNPRHHRRQPPSPNRLRTRPLSNFHNPSSRCSSRNILRSYSRNRIHIHIRSKVRKASSKVRSLRQP